jgi:hypothetical protein
VAVLAVIAVAVFGGSGGSGNKSSVTAARLSIPSPSAVASEPAPSQSPSPTTHEVSGVVTVTDFSNDATDSIATANGFDTSNTYDVLGTDQARLDFLNSLVDGKKSYDCSAGLGGGYGDLAAGGNVVIRDGSGTILGTGSITSGRLDSSGCHLSWNVDDVPDAEFYQVTVTHRGELDYSRSQLESKNWEIDSDIA